MSPEQSAALPILTLGPEKERTMKKLLPMLVLVLLLAGCPMRPRSAQDKITNAMREACPLFSDPEIAAKLAGFEAARDNGTTEIQMLNSAAIVCAGPTNGLALLCPAFDSLCLARADWSCLVCNTAVIDWVYGF